MTSNIEIRRDGGYRLEPSLRSGDLDGSRSLMAEREPLSRSRVAYGTLRRAILGSLICGIAVATDDLIIAAYGKSPPPYARSSVANAIFHLRSDGLPIEAVNRGRKFKGYQLGSRS